MSLTKEFFHDEICLGQLKAKLELDLQYQKEMIELAKHLNVEIHNPLSLDDIEKINSAKKEEDFIELEAKKSSFVNMLLTFLF